MSSDPGNYDWLIDRLVADSLRGPSKFDLWHGTAEQSFDGFPESVPVIYREPLHRWQHADTLLRECNDSRQETYLAIYERDDLDFRPLTPQWRFGWEEYCKEKQLIKYLKYEQRIHAVDLERSTRSQDI